MKVALGKLTTRTIRISPPLPGVFQVTVNSDVTARKPRRHRWEIYLDASIVFCRPMPRRMPATRSVKSHSMLHVKSSQSFVASICRLNTCFPKGKSLSCRNDAIASPVLTKCGDLWYRNIEHLLLSESCRKSQYTL